MDERRKSPRRRTEHFFGVYDCYSSDYVGKLIDLSIMGLLLRAERLMKIDGIYEFRVELPKPIAKKTELVFDAKCIWCLDSTHLDGKYDAGFNITNISFEEIETIQYLLDDALFQDAKQQPRITLTRKP